MNLIRISITRDATIDRTSLLDKVVNTALEKTVTDLLPSRNTTDNIRIGLSHAADTWRKFDRHGKRCKLLITPTDGSKQLDLRIHVQARDTQNVDYSELILSLTGTATSGVTATATEAGTQLYPDIVAALSDLGALEQFGAAYLCDTDIRRLLQALLQDITLPLWPGVMLSLDADTDSRVTEVQQLVADTVTGAATCCCVSLDNTPANRVALAGELAENFTSEANNLVKRLSYPAPALKQIRRDYDALAQRCEETEKLLSVEIATWDALADLEMQLVAAETVAATSSGK